MTTSNEQKMSVKTFNEELARIKGVLFTFAIRLTKNQEDAKDLIQETVLRAYKHRDKFKVGTNFKSWCAAIMRNTFINQYRKNKRRRHINEPIESFLYMLESQNAIANQGETKIMLEEYQNTINELRQIYRVPFLMFFQGFEYKEIAEHLELPIGTVKSRIFFARKKLKQLLKERFGDQVQQKTDYNEKDSRPHRLLELR